MASYRWNPLSSLRWEYFWQLSIARFTASAAPSRLAVRKAPSSEPSILLPVRVSTVKRYDVEGFRSGTRNWYVKSCSAVAPAHSLAYRRLPVAVRTTTRSWPGSPGQAPWSTVRSEPSASARASVRLGSMPVAFRIASRVRRAQIRTEVGVISPALTPLARCAADGAADSGEREVAASASRSRREGDQ